MAGAFSAAFWRAKSGVSQRLPLPKWPPTPGKPHPYFFLPNKNVATVIPTVAATAKKMVLMPMYSPIVSATAPTMLGIRMLPKLAVVKITLQAIG